MFRKYFALVVVLTIGFVAMAAAQQFAGWTAAVNVTPVNTVGGNEKNDPFVSKDGLSLYFSCRNCPGGYGGYDIYVARRWSVNDPWETPQNAGPGINTPYNEGSPALSVDGHRLYFTSDHPGGFGGDDLWVARRHNKRDDFSWRAPENLGDGVNTSANEAGATLFEDELTGVTTLYFYSARPDDMGLNDIYASTLRPDESFGPALLVEELSTSADDKNPSVSRDGLEMYVTSNRPGSILNLKGAPSNDIWVATRTSAADPWSPPVNADPSGSLKINSNRHEGGAELSFDGTTLFFHAAQRPENVSPGCPSSATCYFDIWVTTREKLLPEAAQH